MKLSHLSMSEKPVASSATTEVEEQETEVIQDEAEIIFAECSRVTSAPTTKDLGSTCLKHWNSVLHSLNYINTCRQIEDCVSENDTAPIM